MFRRREFLTNSCYGLGALALAENILASGEKSPLAGRAKRCIFLNMIGGCSQVDLFDPKEKLKKLDGEPLPSSFLEKYRFPGGQEMAKETVALKASPRRFAQYGDSGLVFSDLLPHVAGQADRITMIRSMHTDDVIHAPAQMRLATGFPRAGFPSIGSWVCHGMGQMSRELPNYMVMWSGQQNYQTNALWQGSPLPGNQSAVPIRPGDVPIANLKPAGQASAPAIQQASLTLLDRLHQHAFGEQREGRACDSIRRRMESYQEAFRLQMAAPDLFDLSDEAKHTIDSYGLDRPGLYDGQFAKNCLLARRMVERGVRFVCLFHSHWDNHDDIDTVLPDLCRTVDQPVAALLGDLAMRGLLDDTLVVWGTEFGRTCFAEIRNSKPGRDHHVDAFSIWMAGAGLRPGVTLGETDDLGWAPVTRPIHVRDLHATLLHLFGLDQYQLELNVSGRPVRLTDTGGRIVEEILA